MKKIYFIVPYPHGEAPSQRFRFEQYLDLLRQKGFEYHISSFLDLEAWDILYKPGHYLSKIVKILSGFGHRFADLFKMSSYDFIFIHREASPIGPPVFEWIMAKVLRKKIIYDFDDAIWLANTSANNKIAAGIKFHGKVKDICKWSYKISCGNDYLADFARAYNSEVIVNPTTIDTVNLHNRIKDQNTEHLTIGWTGTHSTIQYLDELVPILQKLEKTMRFTFTVISNSPPEFELRSLKYVPWNKATEIDDLMDFNIGIMPLRDDKWAKGKCGFKALQYMSLGIPAIVSPVGVNTRIVDNGVNGIICQNNDEWEKALTEFIQDRSLRIKMGTEARKKVENKYSVLSNSANFTSLFE